jgi:predicted kinase
MSVTSTLERAAAVGVATRKPRLIVVSGAPATGKTSLARSLGSSLGLPVLHKDHLKEAIADETGPPPDVATSQRLGLAAYRVLFEVTAELVAAGSDLIIESNFRRGRSEGELAAFVAAADARLVHCTASSDIVLARYRDRFKRGERHPAHLDADRQEGLVDDLESGLFGPLALDVPTLVVRTDDGYAPGLPEIVAFAGGGRS